MVVVRLYIFASIREILSEQRERQISLDKTHWSCAKELQQHLLKILKEDWLVRQKDTNAVLTNLPPIMLIINESYVDPNQAVQLSDQDTICLIPPITGG